MNYKSIIAVLLGVALIGVGVTNYAAEEFSDQELEIITQFLEEKEAELIAEGLPEFSPEPVMINNTKVFPAEGVDLKEETLKNGAFPAYVEYEGSTSPLLIFFMSLPEGRYAEYASALFNPDGKAFAVYPGTKETGKQEVEGLEIELSLPEEDEGKVLLTLKYNDSLFKLTIPKSDPTQ